MNSIDEMVWDPSIHPFLVVALSKFSIWRMMTVLESLIDEQVEILYHFDCYIETMIIIFWMLIETVSWTYVQLMFLRKCEPSKGVTPLFYFYIGIDHIVYLSGDVSRLINHSIASIHSRSLIQVGYPYQVDFLWGWCSSNTWLEDPRLCLHVMHGT